MSLSNVIDNITAIGEKARADIQKIPEEAFKTNPTDTRKQVEALVAPLAEQMTNLQKITNALVSQAQTV
jgi:predicted PurR-regulated permease PerM